MSVCSRSDINMSKSDLNVRSDVIVTVRWDIRGSNYVDVSV